MGVVEKKGWCRQQKKNVDLLEPGHLMNPAIRVQDIIQIDDAEQLESVSTHQPTGTSSPHAKKGNPGIPTQSKLFFLADRVSQLTDRDFFRGKTPTVREKERPCSLLSIQILIFPKLQATILACSVDLSLCRFVVSRVLCVCFCFCLLVLLLLFLLPLLLCN